MNLSDWAAGLAFIIIVMFAFILGAGIRIARSAPAPSETCWKDPHPERSFDFDFMTGIDNKPSRCGYLQTGVLPTVIGARGLDLTLQCYPLAPIKCP